MHFKLCYFRDELKVHDRKSTTEGKMKTWTQLSLYDKTAGQLYDMMSIDEMRQHEWDVSWSGGKDSTATLILMHENDVPVKRITYVRMMYDDSLPATLPVMNEFVEKAIRKIDGWGTKVEVLTPKRSAADLRDRTYQRSMYEIRNGKKYGISAFSRGRCNMTSTKTETIKKSRRLDAYEMIGYAADEFDRLHRLGGRRQSILATMGVYEDETFGICRKYDLLSPLYELGMERDGCWFCPNCAKKQRQYIHENYPELIELIYDMIRETDMPIERMPNCWIEDFVKHGHELKENQKGLIRESTS
jgi:3'-phosphoadenosine 5'-phosphosulfate sulfotransferase (PAPS reductase)/FAD synthetase